MGHPHTHRRLYQSVVIRGTSGDTLNADAGVIEPFDLKAGSAYWYGPDDLLETHALRNTGEDEILIVTTEFLS